MSNIKSILDKFCYILKWIAGILLLAMLAITFIQVVLRYVFKNPFSWAEEVTLAMLIWFGYITIALVVREDEHMAIGFLYNMSGKKMRLLLDSVRHILMIFFSVLMAKYGAEMINNALGKVLPASKISRSLLYVPFMLSGILIALFSLIHLINLFIQLQDKEGI
jgi:TRAP-type C4-dicarboxylate transport system permease small subunit